MTIPSTLAGHIRHCFPNGAQTDALIRLAEAVDKLNERCACVNTIELGDAVEVIPPVDVPQSPLVFEELGELED
jgi:hypothetical protein